MSYLYNKFIYYIFSYLSFFFVDKKMIFVV